MLQSRILKAVTKTGVKMLRNRPTLRGLFSSSSHYVYVSIVAAYETCQLLRCLASSRGEMLCSWGGYKATIATFILHIAHKNFTYGILFHLLASRLLYKCLSCVALLQLHGLRDTQSTSSSSHRDKISFCHFPQFSFLLPPLCPLAPSPFSPH